MRDCFKVPSDHQKLLKPKCSPATLTCWDVALTSDTTATGTFLNRVRTPKNKLFSFGPCLELTVQQCSLTFFTRAALYVCSGPLIRGVFFVSQYGEQWGEFGDILWHLWVLCSCVCVQTTAALTSSLFFIPSPFLVGICSVMQLQLSYMV